MEKAAKSNHEVELGDHNELRPYQKPSIRVMDEKEVLSAFQVTVAGARGVVASGTRTPCSM